MGRGRIIRLLTITLGLGLASTTVAGEFRHAGDFLLQSHFKLTGDKVTPVPMKPIAFRVFTDGTRIKVSAEGDDEVHTTFEIYRSDGIGRQRSGRGALEVIPGLQATCQTGGVLRHLRLSRESLTITTFPGVSDQTIVSHAIAGRAETGRSTCGGIPANETMKPLPAQTTIGGKVSGETIPSLPTALATPAGQYSKTNRRASTNPGQRAYPWLLSASTAIAVIFCLLYITKPVIMSASSAAPVSSAKPQPALAGTPPVRTGMMPSGDRLPGEHLPAAVKPVAADRRALPGPPSASAFEETNLRIQHILTAEAPGGHLDRIDIDVPVIYQSRNLRWTATEVEEARTLLARLMDYQEKSQSLRAEGIQLLDSWNRLIGDTIPAADLRADSPSLPANQEDSAVSPIPVGSTTTESIQLQPAGK